MKIKTVETSNGRIACAESSGRGPGALLVHGNSGSRHVWDALLNGPLGARRRLVALDLPGHGDSSPAVFEDDALAALTTALVEVAELSSGHARSVVVGHSLGGHLALEALARGGLSSLRGICLHGAPPLGSATDFPRAFRPSAVMGTAFEAAPSEAALERLLVEWYGPHRAPPGEARVDFLRTQAELRPAIARAIASGKLADERAVVATLSVPIAILNGADDPFIDVDYLASLSAPTLWRGGVQSIENCGHFPQWEQPERYSEGLDAFLRDVYGE
jgi:pimeloyl-ACP methyl ester carboxylesterase